MCNPIHFIHLAMYWIVIMVVTRSGYPSGYPFWAKFLIGELYKSVF